MNSAEYHRDTKLAELGSDAVRARGQCRPDRDTHEVGTVVDDEGLHVLVDHPSVPPAPASQRGQRQNGERGEPMANHSVERVPFPARHYQQHERTPIGRTPIRRSVGGPAAPVSPSVFAHDCHPAALFVDQATDLRYSELAQPGCTSRPGGVSGRSGETRWNSTNLAPVLPGQRSAPTMSIGSRVPLEQE